MPTTLRQRLSLAILTSNTTTVASLNQTGTCHSNSGGQISRRRFHYKVISTSRPRNLGRVCSENLSSNVLTIHALDVSHMTLTDKHCGFFYIQTTRQNLQTRQTFWSPGDPGAILILWVLHQSCCDIMATREASYIDKLHGSAVHICCNLGQGYMFLETLIAVKLHENGYKSWPWTKQVSEDGNFVIWYR